MTISYLLVAPILISFFISLLFLPFWIRKARGIGLVWKDMNKLNDVQVPGSGGIIVLLGFVIGILAFIAYRTFILDSDLFLIEILAMLSVVLFLGGIGLIDDLLGWQKGGLRRRQRILLTGLAAIPLMVINAGRSEIGIPFNGVVDFGIIYPLVLIPIGIIGATTTFNFLAGFNGLEAGQGIIVMLGLGLVSYFTGNSWLTIICLCMAAALFGFLFYNRYPAKVFPGDSITYPLGGLIAIIAILGNFERVAVFFFVPFIIETVLKSRGKLIKESFGKPNESGALDLKYDKIYSLNHLAISLIKKFSIKPTEKRVVYLIWTFQILIILLGLLLFKEGIFNG